MKKILFKIYISLQNYLLKHTNFLEFDYTKICDGFEDIRVGDYFGEQ